MDNTQRLLQISAKLLKHLTDIPKGEDRSEYIDEINLMLDERGALIDKLSQEGFVMDANNKIHNTLAQLDKGIRERLDDVMKLVKQDMKDLQNSKKNEKQYMNPYSSVQVMDGMYYDKKK
ncbi:flagellar protein FliT [Lysinibacillus sp. SGAir0095]|uniref:flagellar protein FliT n=1 Tax=Lysinibacillus sp. SGAir0095 TaxID=2070463 RepID=UPI0010CCBD46|nr:flagellar protein FliT [Lysinibacillus sp. SGAir0095]QCR31527.1 flagellar protein FliT [Lysinibacillus sp. SGAir0095]